MHSKLFYSAIFATCLFAVSTTPLFSQTAASAAASAPASAPAGNAVATPQTKGIESVGGPAEAADFVQGFNVSLADESDHVSGSGWENVITPDVSYDYDKHIGIDFTFPYYTYLDTSSSHVVLTPLPIHVVTTPYVANWAIGDASSSVNLSFSPSLFNYVFTATGGFPIGNTQYNLSATEYTYLVNNHFDQSFGIFTPEVEIGFGDDSNLGKHRIVRSTLEVGNLAFFTAGTGVELPWGMTFTADAYEQLPTQNLDAYKTIRTPKGRKLKVQTGAGPAEDNGFETSLDIPITDHLTLSGEYDRSLRQYTDTAGFSLTYVLRVPRKAPEPTPAPAK